MSLFFVHIELEDYEEAVPVEATSIIEAVEIVCDQRALDLDFVSQVEIAYDGEVLRSKIRGFSN